MPKKSGKKTRAIRAGNLAEDVAGRLREGIRIGRYLPGTPLREEELARELALSRVPVREALHLLKGEGLVELRPNQGARVALVSEHELTEIAELCRLLEAHLLGRAVRVLRAEDLDAAGALLDELEGVRDLAEWSRINWRFHTRLYRAAERPLVIEVLTGLRARAEGAMRLLVASPARREELNREHRALLELLCAGRHEQALAVLDAHLSRSKDTILDLVEGS